MGSIVPAACANNERFRFVGKSPSGKPVYESNPLGNLVAPASARPGVIGDLDDAFAARAADEDICSVCALSFDGQPYVLAYDLSTEPPMHVACAAYALVACPHLRRIAALTVTARVEINDDDELPIYSPDTESPQLSFPADKVAVFVEFARWFETHRACWQTYAHSEVWT